MSLPPDTPDDPRVDQTHVRTVPTDTAPIILIGVVHDHPSSAHRVRTIVEAVDPSTVALELPALAVPLYEAFARAEPDETRGGEMRAAIEVTDDARIVGIDAPSRRFCRALLATYRESDASASELRRVLTGLARVTRRGLHCRLAAPIVRWTPFDVNVDRPTKHGCTPADEPSVQAADERRQIARSVALLGALDGGTATALRDQARERAMAAALEGYCGAGAVVAVVGRDHLDPVAELLDERI